MNKAIFKVKSPPAKVGSSKEAVAFCGDGPHNGQNPVVSPFMLHEKGLT
jgi:hypothetical protein